jgi:hypothetical protein
VDEGMLVPQKPRAEIADGVEAAGTRRGRAGTAVAVATRGRGGGFGGRGGGGDAALRHGGGSRARHGDGDLGHGTEIL